MMQVECAVILAGGLGSRLRSVVSDVPKPMAPVGGKPFLSHLMEWLIAQGIKKIILSVGYKSEMIERFYGDYWQGAELFYAKESEPIGTGGGLVNAIQKLSDPKALLVVNGDTFFPLDLKTMWKMHLEKKSEMTIAGFFSQATDRYSFFKVSRDTRIVEKINSDNGFVSGGVYLLCDQLVKFLKSLDVSKLSFENELTPQLLSEKWRVFGHPSNAFFIDIGVPEDYEKAQSAQSFWHESY